MAREPARALSNLCVGLKQYQGLARLKYLTGNAYGEMFRSSGVPLLYPTCKFIYDNFGHLGLIMDTESNYKLELSKDVELREPDLDDREQYHEAYGISAEDQILIERDIQDSIWAGVGLSYTELAESRSDIQL